MTLSEIETILLELSARHPNLNQALLTTLLASAGWEEKTIKEAIVLFNQKGGDLQAKVSIPKQEAIQTVSLPAQQNQPAHEVMAPLTAEAPITFYQPDGTEEGQLHAFTDVPVIKEKVVIPEVKIPSSPPLLKNEEPLPQAQEVEITPPVPPKNEIVQPVQQVPPVESIAVTQKLPPMTEPQSLITHDEAMEKRSTEKQGVLPSNLPLLPFESSPHIWSFAKYKDVFHGETPIPEEIKVITVMPQEAMPAPAPQQVVQVVKQQVTPSKDEEVVVESVPLRKDDKPLVFLATVMLLAIILILGYMYSNGRL